MLLRLRRSRLCSMQSPQKQQPMSRIRKTTEIPQFIFFNKCLIFENSRSTPPPFSWPDYAKLNQSWSFQCLLFTWENWMNISSSFFIFILRGNLLEFHLVFDQSSSVSGEFVNLNMYRCLVWFHLSICLGKVRWLFYFKCFQTKLIFLRS